jgi:hypothetical protein
MTARALQVTARRLQLLRAEADTLQHDIHALVAAVAPWLLELPGVGPITAAQVLVSWSRAGRWRSEAVFAALAGTSPIPASSGRVTRYRLNRPTPTGRSPTTPSIPAVAAGSSWTGPGGSGLAPISVTRSAGPWCSCRCGCCLCWGARHGRW